MAATSARSRPTGAQIALMAAATLVLIFSVVRAFDPIPTIAIPTPKMPSPNGYDVLIKAHNACKERDTVAAAAFPSSRFGNRHKYTPEQQKKLRDENLDALALIRQGIDMPFRLPPVRGFDNMMPGADPYRLSGLLILDAHIRERQNDWKGAAESVMQAIKLNEIEPTGGGMFSLLSADRCLTLSLNALLTISPHLDAAANLQLASRLSDLAPLHVPFADTLTTDKWAEVASLQTLLKGPRWREQITQMVNGNGSSGISAFTPINRRKLYKDYMDYMDQQIAQAKRPYNPASNVWVAPSDPILRALAMPTNQAQAQDATAVSQTAATIVRMGIEAYRQKHGQYPASLNALVPEVFKQLPSDPMSNGNPPGYKLDKQGYTLYSNTPQPIPGPTMY